MADSNLANAPIATVRRRFESATVMPIATKGGLDAVQQLVEQRDLPFMPPVVTWLEACVARKVAQGVPADKRVTELLGRAKAVIAAADAPVDRTILASETVLEDDYPIYFKFIYLMDGIPRASNHHNSTVRQLKRREGINEVRRCSLVEREALMLPPFHHRRG